MLADICLASDVTAPHSGCHSRGQALLTGVGGVVGWVESGQRQEGCPEEVFQGSWVRRGTEEGHAPGMFGWQSAGTFRNPYLLSICRMPGRVLDAGDAEKD